MASSTSNDLKLELITTGEKSGTWGTITNTNLQILEQAASGYLSLAVGSADVALSLANYATSNGKNLYIKLTGTLGANRSVTIPDGAERVIVFEDANGDYKTRGNINDIICHALSAKFKFYDIQSSPNMIPNGFTED